MSDFSWFRMSIDMLMIPSAILYPSAISLPTLISHVSELAHLLSTECFAERYALTLRLVLANFRRQTGAVSTVSGTPRPASRHATDTLPTQPGTGNGAIGDLDGGLQSLLSLPQMNEGSFDELPWSLAIEETEGFAWPTEFNANSLPVWLQDGVCFITYPQ